MKDHLTRKLSYFIDYMSINGLYIVIVLFFALNLNIESRFYTIPIRILVTLSMILLVILKRFRPCRNVIVYMFFFWFFAFYWFKIVLEMFQNHQSFHIPPYEYLLYSIVYGFFPFLYFSQRKTLNSYEQIFRSILFSGLLFSVILIFLFIKTSIINGTFDRYLLGISPLTISYVGSLISGICFSRLVFEKDNKNSRLLLVGMFIGICPLLIGGSRGPVLSLVIPLIIVFLLKTKMVISRKSVKYVILLIIVLSIALWIFGSIAFDRLSNIFKDLASNSKDVARLEIWNTAFSQFLRSPVFGDSIQVKGFDWPHNLSLEVLMSTGIIGYIPFFVLICYGLYKGFHILRFFPTYIWVCIFYFQSLIMGMLSGNVYSDIWFWSSLGLILSVNMKVDRTSTEFNSSALVN